LLKVPQGTESGKNGGERLHKAVVDSLVHDYGGRTLLSSHYHESLARQIDMDGILFVQAHTGDKELERYTITGGVDEGGYAVNAAIEAGLPESIVNRL